MERPRIRPFRLVTSWLVSAGALLLAAAIVPGVTVHGFRGAVVAVLVIAVLNAVLPPILAAARLPFMALLGFLLVLLLDAALLLLAARIGPADLEVDSLGWAIVASLVAAAAGVVLDVLLGTNDDDTYTIRVVQRIARRSGEQVRTDAPGIVFLEIDGLALPVLRRAMRDGSAPELARWVAEEGYRPVEWETDLSSQTGASQAGILLGANDDIPAFRWVEKESGRLMVCSAPDDCEEIERRHARGSGLLRDGGASRGNLLSGEADHVILTASRIGAEKRANPGYRAFFANGFNVTRTLVLFGWELVLEWTAAARAARRDVRPRGHRGGVYPFLRATMCVLVRDLIVYGVLTDMMKGRPAVYATFSSYDEVAHHSGLERADTLEALRKLDQQFGRIARARRYAPRPYELVVLSDHGQTQGATFRQRNGYGLEELVRRSLAGGSVEASVGGDETDAMVGHALGEATGTTKRRTPGEKSVAGENVVVLGSGNLGLVYLMEERRRLTLEEIEERHPDLLPALRAHPHVGFVLARSGEHGPVALGARGANHLAERRVEGDDPLAPFPGAARHLLRTDGFRHAPDLLVNSFYDPALDEGCAFEELISFHGGLGGLQTRPFLLVPPGLPLPEEPVVGAAAVHELLWRWRRLLQEPGGGRAVAGGVMPGRTADQAGGGAVRLELGATIRCTDAEAGRLADVVVDPGGRRVTHLVVRSPDGIGRLVPITRVSPDGGGAPLSLSCTTGELARFEASEEFAVLPLGEIPEAGEGWDLGVEDAVALPSYQAAEFGDYVGDVGSTVGVTYDRIPRGTVELRRTSTIEAADGARVGHVDAVVVEGAAITHIACRRGHLWWRREVAIPVEATATLETDLVRADLSSEEIAALPAAGSTVP